MTSLTKRATPETDALLVHEASRTHHPFSPPGKMLLLAPAPALLDLARSLEQRLGAVTEALEVLLETYEPDEHRSAAVYTYHCPLCYARVTLAAIKAKP